MGSPPRRKEIPLKGPRPSAVAVAKDSLKTKKPPLPPSRALQVRQHKHNQQRRRQPLIIYELPPEVIHIPAADFMAYVQQQTGYHPSAAASTSSGEVPTAAPHSPPGIPSPTPISPNIFCPPPPPPPLMVPPPLPKFNQNPVHQPYGFPNFSSQDYNFFNNNNSFPDDNFFP